MLTGKFSVKPFVFAQLFAKFVVIPQFVIECGIDVNQKILDNDVVLN